MDIKLYNSLEREKAPFKPLDPDHVKIYACGPTVYNYAHIGNARMAVVFDLLADVLRTAFPTVTYVSNITDIDDKIIIAAKETGEAIDKITTKYRDIYNEDMAVLGVKTPDVQPHATAHIPEMISLISTLIEKGHAYEAEGHALFHVPSYPAYGGLSGRSRDEQVAGARVDVAPFKKDPADFVLWKPSTGDQPGWDSPWGFGRPGWHIECSAMAEKHLGLPFDIHGGGADLKFPHHENEIAQSCCAMGETEDLSAFAKIWIHNGFVTVEGEKMSKSIGNIRLVHDLIKDYEGEVLRLTLLSGHYRQPLNWSPDTIGQNKKQLDRLYQTMKALDDVDYDEGAAYPAEFLGALYDDLNTPKALSVLNALAKKAQETRSPADKSAFIKSANLIGILTHDADEWLGYGQETACSSDDGYSAQKIEALLNERAQARADKNYTRSDEIRDELLAAGITIEDTTDGAQWRRT